MSSRRNACGESLFEAHHTVMMCGEEEQQLV
jgi:hypothetical protein